MNYEKFQKMLAEEVIWQTGGKVKATLQKLPKNNGVTVDALEMKGPQDLLCPSVYIDGFYEQYLKGVSIRHLAKLMIEQYEEFKKKNQFPADFFKDYEKISAHVYCKLINYKRNRTLLQKVPHTRWMDLAVVYYYQVEKELVEDAAILIRNSHLKRWNVSAAEVEEKAWLNTKAELLPVMQELSQILCQWGELEQEEKQMLEDHSLFLLTNQNKYLGAICICYPGKLKEIAEVLKADYYILPSSIHECLILPSKGQYHLDELQEMVKEINETQLQPQEVLSDHVYFYDRAQERLRLGTLQIEK